MLDLGVGRIGVRHVLYYYGWFAIIRAVPPSPRLDAPGWPPVARPRDDDRSSSVVFRSRSRPGVTPWFWWADRCTWSSTVGAIWVRKETASMPPRLTSISADLGTLKAPWVAWCAKQKIKPSDALRQILTKVLGQTPPGGPTVRPTVPHRA